MTIYRSDQSDFGTAGACLLLDASLSVIHCGAAAEHVLRQNAEVLLLVERRLYTPKRPQFLQAGLRQAVEGGIAAWSLPRSGRLPLTLKAQRRLSEAPGPQLQLRLCDPHLLEPDITVLASLLLLTQAEAKVAHALTVGHSTAEIAARMGVQVNTVQTHIKRALQKTGLRRQTELVSLILRSVAMPVEFRRHDEPHKQQLCAGNPALVAHEP